MVFTIHIPTLTADINNKFNSLCNGSGNPQSCNENLLCTNYSFLIRLYYSTCTREAIIIITISTCFEFQSNNYKMYITVTIIVLNEYDRVLKNVLERTRDCCIEKSPKIQ